MIGLPFSSVATSVVTGLPFSSVTWLPCSSVTYSVRTGFPFSSVTVPSAVVSSCPVVASVVFSVVSFCPESSVFSVPVLSVVSASDGVAALQTVSPLPFFPIAALL